MSDFAQTLERVCVQTVEEGSMTRDLARLIGPEQPWQTTQEFLSSIERNLIRAMAAGSPGFRRRASAAEHAEGRHE